MLSVNSDRTILRFVAGLRDEGAKRPKNAGQPQIAAPPVGLAAGGFIEAS